MAINKLELEGNLVRPIEVVSTKGGLIVAKGTIACSNDYRDKRTNEWIKKPATFFEFKIFNNDIINAMRLIDPGSRIHIAGKLSQEEWMDQMTGKKRTKHNLTVFQLFETATQNKARIQPTQAEPDQKQQTTNHGDWRQAFDTPEIREEDVPF